MTEIESIKEDILDKNKHNTLLYLDDILYISEYNENPINYGCLKGKYYGSTTRLFGGEIWDKSNGYKIIKIKIEIINIDSYEKQIIYEEIINFYEELKKNENLLNKNINNNICNIVSGDYLILKNNLYEIKLNFRDLHRWNGEVQLSGCVYKLIK